MQCVRDDCVPRVFSTVMTNSSVVLVPMHSLWSRDWTNENVSMELFFFFVIVDVLLCTASWRSFPFFIFSYFYATAAKLLSFLFRSSGNVLSVYKVWTENENKRAQRVSFFYPNMNWWFLPSLCGGPCLSGGLSCLQDKATHNRCVYRLI